VVVGVDGNRAVKYDDPWAASTGEYAEMMPHPSAFRRPGQLELRLHDVRDLTSVTAVVTLLAAPLSLLDRAGLIGVPTMYWSCPCPS
jgi:hypothetical protein